MSFFKCWQISLVVVLVLICAGCESKLDRLKQSLESQIAQANSSLTVLNSQLEGNQLRNALLLKEYAQQLSRINPEYSRIAQLLAEDATPQGPLFKGLQNRLSDIKSTTVTDNNAEQLLQRTALVIEASQKNLFNDALTDPMNVIADLSNGQLARVGAISQQAENSSAQGSNFGPGSQLIGNPNYGSWQTGSDGLSFWEWYGMYALFSNIVDAVEFGYWSKRRRYSYYHDYGRYRYSSYKQKNQYRAVEQKTRKSYQSKGRQFSSPYAKSRSGARGLSRASHTPSVSRSSYSRSSSYSKGSVRNSHSRTSRGLSRGK